MNTEICKLSFRKDRPSPLPSPIRWERESRSRCSITWAASIAMDASGQPETSTGCPLSHRMGEGQGEGISGITLKNHPKQIFVFLTSALILTTSALAQDHGHLNVGAVSTNQDSQLIFDNGADFATDANYVKTLDYATT